MDAIEFLHLWGAENVHPMPEANKLSEAERLAMLCIAAAATQGIDEDDLEAAAGEDMISYMSDLIDNANTAELDRLTKSGN